MFSLYTVFRAVGIFLELIEWAIVIYCVLSWFQPRFKACDPLLRRARGLYLPVCHHRLPDPGAAVVVPVPFSGGADVLT